MVRLAPLLFRCCLALVEFFQLVLCRFQSKYHIRGVCDGALTAAFVAPSRGLLTSGVSPRWGSPNKRLTSGRGGLVCDGQEREIGLSTL